MKYTSLILIMMVMVAMVEGKVVKDKVKGNKGNFVFLSKFCYDTVPAADLTAAGTLHYTIHTQQQSLWILFYDDEKTYWPSVYRSSLSCQEKRAAMFAGYLAYNNQSNTVGFRDVVQPHFWYVVACNCDAPVDLEYELTFLNYGDNKWTKQFSADDIGLEGLYLAYFVFYFIGVIVHFLAVWNLMQTKSYHSIVKLLTISIVLSFLSVLFNFIHYAVYQNNGIGAPGLKGIGDLLDIASQIIFILLLVLLAKGWCISKTQFDDKKLVLVGLGLLSASYLVMFIWWNAGVDPADTLYIYTSPPGIITIVIRGLAMFWFLWSIRLTYLEENTEAKKQFYLWFGVCYTVWLLILPIIAGIAAGLKPWERLRTVTILYVTATAVGQAGLGFLLWPSRANEYFQISSRLDLAGTIPYDTI